MEESPTGANQREEGSGSNGGKHAEAERILRVLETIKKEGLKGIGNFILLALSSEDPRVKSHISPIYQSKGKAFNILEILLNSCVTQRRQTGKYVGELRERFGGILKTIFQDLLKYELRDVMQDQEIHRSPSSLNSDIASEFAFKNFQHVFEEKAPFTWGVLCHLCGLDETSVELVSNGGESEVDDDEEEEGDEDPDGEDGGGAQEEGEKDNEAHAVTAVGNQSRGRKHLVVDRYLRATILFGIIMNSRNVKVNYFQAMVRGPPSDITLATDTLS